MRKEYTDNLLFDNLEESESEQRSAFSMEACIRSPAQPMIQAALEVEVREFLQCAKYAKTSKDEFRGYRNRHHTERTVSTTVGGLNVPVPRVSDNREAFQLQLVKPYKRRWEGLD